MNVCSDFYLFFNDTATTEIYTYVHTLSLHDALPICLARARGADDGDLLAGGDLEVEIVEDDERSVALHHRFEVHHRLVVHRLTSSGTSASIRSGALRDRKSTRLNSSH